LRPDVGVLGAEGGDLGVQALHLGHAAGKLRGPLLQRLYAGATTAGNLCVTIVAPRWGTGDYAFAGSEGAGGPGRLERCAVELQPGEVTRRTR
jgi:hypothetical protein